MHEIVSSLCKIPYSYELLFFSCGIFHSFTYHPEYQIHARHVFLASLSLFPWLSFRCPMPSYIPCFCGAYYDHAVVVDAKGILRIAERILKRDSNSVSFFVHAQERQAAMEAEAAAARAKGMTVIAAPGGSEEQKDGEAHTNGN